MASKTEEELTTSDKAKSVETGSWWQSWGKSFVDTVKEKTSSTYEMVQKDLSEFYQTIQTDTAHVVVDAATKVQDQVKVAKDVTSVDGSKQSAFKEGFASILTSVSESLKTLAQEESPLDSEKDAGISMQSPVYDRRKAKIFQIQTEVGTYCNEPEGQKDDFEKWLNAFDFDSKRNEMSDLLVKVPEVRAIYSKLVPSVVSHAVFWQRYFYKIEQFELREERRAALVARAETASLHEEELNWDSDDAEESAETKAKEKVEKKSIEVKKEGDEVVGPDLENEKTEDRSTDEKEPEINTAKNRIESKVVDDTQTSKDDYSFEVLSPTTSIKNKDTTSDSLMSWSIEGDELSGPTSDETVRHSPPSNRSSPTKEDNSSGSSVEVVRQIADKSDGPTRRHSGDRSVAAASSGSAGEKSLHMKALEEMRADQIETASTGSWISVDDEIRVRKSKIDKFINEKGSEFDPTKSPESNRNSGSSSSSAVLVEKSECKEDDDDDDVDIDLDEDINEEELQKIMEKISSKSGDLDDDNDWEDWE